VYLSIKIVAHPPRSSPINFRGGLAQYSFLLIFGPVGDTALKYIEAEEAVIEEDSRPFLCQLRRIEQGSMFHSLNASLMCLAR
jgi:hypothetical protein